MKFGDTTYMLAAVAVLATGTLAPADARAEDERGVVVFAQGGGFSPLADLNDAGSATFKTGFATSGGIGYQFNRYVVLRGAFTFARTEADAPAFSIDSTKFNRFAYDADVQLRYPTDAGLTPASA